MPELPEVETIVKTLEKSLIGTTIEKISLSYDPLMEMNSEYQLDKLVGHKFIEFKRRGKYVWFVFDGGYNWIIHLRMEGKFYLYDSETPRTPHTHVVVKTNNGWIHYLDTRKFSRMAVTMNPDKYFEGKNLGFEPFDEKIDIEIIYRKINKSSRYIKLILLDQSIMTGIGNIYADEILFDTRINPETRGNRISRSDVKRIVESTQKILAYAISAGGTTIRSYTSSLNVHGRFQLNLNAYGQERKPCIRCETPLKRIVLGGRSSTYCPKCQKVRL